MPRERIRVAKDSHIPLLKSIFPLPAGQCAEHVPAARTHPFCTLPLAHLYGVGNERLRRGLRADTQQAPHKRGKGTGNHECRKLPAKTR